MTFRRPVRRIALVGLSGAGKSTVGPIVAERLGWRFIDFDDEIVRRTAMSVAELFQRDGETAFRAMEARLTVELSSLSEIVLAPGGGWAAQPESWAALPADTASVWLRVSPDEAIRRLAGSPVARPLLAGDDPTGALRALAERRNEHYARADLVMDVDELTPNDVALGIVEWLRQNAL
jgi:shikimate kinase